MYFNASLKTANFDSVSCHSFLGVESNTIPPPTPTFTDSSVCIAEESVKVGVGGGIVFDSTPKNEWQETESKLAVFREALKYK